ncbi:Protein of unknown function [Bacillus mycoides]|nr:Protein of unknown function [Bacillus mycoides]
MFVQGRKKFYLGE